jgi:hypothetical protein
VAGLICVACARQATAADEIIDRVLAVAGGTLILQSDVAAARELGLVTAPPQSGDPVRATLSALIDRALVLAEVERYAPPEPSAAAVSRELEAIRGRFRSPTAFVAALVRLGIDEPHLRNTVRENLRMTAYLEQRFTVAPATDDEVGRYYREHQELFTRGGVVEPFDTARPAAAARLLAERRQALVSDWLAGLRRRAEITDLYLPTK